MLLDSLLLRTCPLIQSALAAVVVVLVSDVLPVLLSSDVLFWRHIVQGRHVEQGGFTLIEGRHVDQMKGGTLIE